LELPLELELNIKDLLKSLFTVVNKDVLIAESLALILIEDFAINVDLHIHMIHVVLLLA